MAGEPATGLPPRDEPPLPVNMSPGCGLAELRSWWEVPAIAHFCSLFRTAFSLPDFEIEVRSRAAEGRGEGSGVWRVWRVWRSALWSWG